MCKEMLRDAHRSALKLSIVVALTASSTTFAGVTFDQSYGYAGAGTSGTTVSSPLPPYTYVPTQINQTATSSSPSVSGYAVGTTDFSSVQSYAGAAGNNHYGITDVGYGYSSGAGIVYKSVNYTADTAGVLTVNTFLDAGSTGTSIGANSSAFTSGTKLIWTASINGAYTHTLGVATYLTSLWGASSPSTLVAPWGGTGTLVTGGDLNGVSIVQSATEASYSWLDTSFTDRIQMAAGQTVNVLYTLNELSLGQYLDNLLTPPPYNCDGGNGANGYSSCGKTWVNFGGVGALDDSISSFDLSFAPDSVTAVPEPSEWALMIAGLGLASVIGKRKATKKKLNQ
jgi:hypothetical protein